MRSRCAESALGSVAAQVRALGGNAGGDGGGCAREVLRAWPLRREYCANWAPREVAPPLLGAKAGWGRREPRWASRAGQRAQAWTCPVRPRVVREELRRDAGECIGGKVGEGAFLVKGQDSCGGQATPSWGRLYALQPGGVWWCPHLVQRLLARGP